MPIKIISDFVDLAHIMSYSNKEVAEATVSNLTHGELNLWSAADWN